jgi:hypothetical protein
VALPSNPLNSGGDDEDLQTPDYDPFAEGLLQLDDFCLGIKRQSMTLDLHASARIGWGG